MIAEVLLAECLDGHGHAHAFVSAHWQPRTMGFLVVVLVRCSWLIRVPRQGVDCRGQQVLYVLVCAAEGDFLE